MDEVFPQQPVRQWILSLPYPLRFLLANHPEVMSGVLRIVCRCIATHQVRKTDIKRNKLQAGAVTLIQRFGGALNLNIHFHMLVLDGVFVASDYDSLRFASVKAPFGTELRKLVHTLAHRIGCNLECQGLLGLDAEISYLSADCLDLGSLAQLQGASENFMLSGLGCWLLIARRCCCAC